MNLYDIGGRVARALEEEWRQTHDGFDGFAESIHGSLSIVVQACVNRLAGQGFIAHSGPILVDPCADEYGQTAEG
jgi:hypothetical protein